MSYLGRGLDKISNIEILDNITFDGSSSYSITKSSVAFVPNSAQSLLISIDGVVQAGNFTVSGSTIDFGTAVAGTSTCNFILHYGIGLITTVSDGTVTTAKLADSSVSLAKLTATGTKDATTFLRGDNTFAVPVGEINTPIVSLSMSASQTTTDATDTLVAFDTADVDTDSAYLNTAGNYKFTVPADKAGTYMINFMATSFNENSATTMVKGIIYKNGSAVATQRQRHDGRRHEGTTTHWVGTLAVSDYIQFYYYHDVTSHVPQLLTEARATIVRLKSS